MNTIRRFAFTALFVLAALPVFGQNRIADEALNIAVNAITNRTISVHLHDGAPGDACTGNRIGTVSTDVASTGWSAGSGGISDNVGAVAMGVLSTTDSNTVTAYSLFDGNACLGWANFASSVAVGANESFSINAGTIDITFGR